MYMYVNKLVCFIVTHKTIGTLWQCDERSLWSQCIKHVVNRWLCYTSRLGPIYLQTFVQLLFHEISPQRRYPFSLISHKNKIHETNYHYEWRTDTGWDSWKTIPQWTNVIVREFFDTERRGKKWYILQSMCADWKDTDASVSDSNELFWKKFIRIGPVH